MIEEDVRNRIALFINSLDYKQKEIAKILDTPESNISKMKKGELSPHNYARQLVHLGLNLNWLYSGQGEMFSSEIIGIEENIKVKKIVKIKKEKLYKYIFTNAISKRQSSLSYDELDNNEKLKSHYEKYVKEFNMYHVYDENNYGFGMNKIILTIVGNTLLENSYYIYVPKLQAVCKLTSKKLGKFIIINTSTNKIVNKELSELEYEFIIGVITLDFEF